MDEHKVTPNPSKVFINAVTFRSRFVQAEHNESITIPQKLFDDLIAVTELASYAEGTIQSHLTLTLTSDENFITATFSSKITGSCSAQGTSILEAIAAVKRELDYSIEKLIR